MGLNANYFYLLTGLVLLGVYVGFKPMELPEDLTHKGEVAELELSHFTMYKVDKTGLQNIMIGKKGFQYKNRLEIKDINYTDSTKKFRSNLKADFGTYDKVDLITLQGNVRYYREDGVRFNSKQARLKQKEETIYVDGRFKLHKFADNVVGDHLFYDTKHGVSRAKNVIGYYTVAD